MAPYKLHSRTGSAVCGVVRARVCGARWLVSFPFSIPFCHVVTWKRIELLRHTARRTSKYTKPANKYTHWWLGAHFPITSNSAASNLSLANLLTAFARRRTSGTQQENWRSLPIATFVKVDALLGLFVSSIRNKIQIELIALDWYKRTFPIVTLL